MFTPSHRGGAGPPLVLLHGFMDTWRVWELVLPTLRKHHDVLAPTLAGHAGGPELRQPLDGAALADEVERAMDEAGFESAHLAGNSLGGYVALQLAERGRALSVTALAPAGGWARVLDFQAELLDASRQTARHADMIVSTPAGRRQATRQITVDYEHIPAELLAHQLRGVAACRGGQRLIEHARAHGWPLDAAKITCPVRIVWGTEDRLLPWPEAAAGYRTRLHAEWIEVDGAGHCLPLDRPLETAELILGMCIHGFPQ